MLLFVLRRVVHRVFECKFFAIAEKNLAYLVFVDAKYKVSSKIFLRVFNFIIADLFDLANNRVFGYFYDPVLGKSGE